MVTEALDRLAETRRRFLNFVLGALGLASMAGVLYPVGAYLWPPRRERGAAGVRSMKFPLSDLPIGEAKFVRFLNKPAVIIRPNEQELVALSAVCTHLGCVVKWAEEAGELVCPCHGGRFDAKGNVLAGPPPSPLPAYPVRVEDEYVVIEEA